MVNKIKNITSNGTFDSQHGTLFKFEYEFEDGTVLTANHKTNVSPFAIGDEAEYTIKGSNSYGSYGSVKKPDDGNFQKPSSHAGGTTYISKGNQSDQILWSVCLKEAVALYPSFEVDLEPLTGEGFDNKLDHVIAICKGLYERSKKEL